MVASLITSKSEAIAEICGRHPIRRLSVFGSAARPDFRADSDVDFLVEFEPGAAVGLIEMSTVRHELGALLGRPIDLVTPRALRPQLRESIIASATPLYAR
jgi:uncharacterized protein